MVNEPFNCILTHRVSSNLVPAGSVVALVPSPEEATRGGLREAVKYYLEDSFPKRGWTPQIRNLFFGENIFLRQKSYPQRNIWKRSLRSEMYDKWWSTIECHRYLRTNYNNDQPGSLAGKPRQRRLSCSGRRPHPRQSSRCWRSSESSWRRCEEQERDFWANYYL